MKIMVFSPKNLGDLRTSRRGRCCKKLGGSDPWICGELKHPPQTSHMGRKAACQKRLKTCCKCMFLCHVWHPN